ncbi:hypothetical protein SAMN05443550_11742 [Pedobacter hartonius]|uniref:Uncharacterized protein n=1 Tax=Pedobacter hartonius TaxID=425514 RepID=A0A1H4HG16_9SPHI|nr:hypothetical protein SAMN05443550_11742 [Pedobacter hartonius]
MPLLTIHGPGKLNNLNFPSLFKLYQEQGYTAGYSHAYMAQHYIDIMAETLRFYDQNRSDISNYQVLAWKGLSETDEYNLKTQAEKSDIENKINALLLNRSKSDCNDVL